MRPPTEKEAFKGQLGAAMEQIQSQMEENSDSLEKYNESAQELLAAYSPEELTAMLLKTVAKDPADSVPVKITPERPLPSNKKAALIVAVNAAEETTVAADAEKITTAKIATVTITITRTKLRRKQTTQQQQKFKP